METGLLIMLSLFRKKKIKKIAIHIFKRKIQK